MGRKLRRILWFLIKTSIFVGIIGFFAVLIYHYGAYMIFDIDNNLIDSMFGVIFTGILMVVGIAISAFAYFLLFHIDAL